MLELREKYIVPVSYHEVNMTQKPSRSEQEFFVREEAEQIRKLHIQKLRQEAALDLEAAKELHYMKCPKCGFDLVAVKRRFVEIDECTNCGVIVLDKGELDKMKAEDHPLVHSLVDLFRKD